MIFIFLMLNIVSAETIVFDYSSASSVTGVVKNKDGSFNWSVPRGAYDIVVEVIGAGGYGGNTGVAAGGSRFATGPGGGGGGGGGAFIQKSFSILSGEFQINVGASGDNFGYSSFDNFSEFGLKLLKAENGRNGSNAGNGVCCSADGTSPGAIGGNGGRVLGIFMNNANIARNGEPGASGGSGNNGYCSKDRRFAQPGAGGIGGSSPFLNIQGALGGPGGCVSGGSGNNGTLGGGGGGNSYLLANTASGGIGRVIIQYNLTLGMVYSNCSIENQTIFSLYQSNNSHVTLWNNESAEYKICYNQIFGRNYNLNNMYTCTGKNSVLNISNLNNAHAEKPYGLNYNVGICYGEMSCAVRVGSCNPGGEQIVARLSGETNAHVSNSSFTLYNNLLCCSEKPLGFNRLSWKDSSEVSFISSAKNGDSVVLYVMTNFTAGTRVTFEIFEDDVLFRNDIRTGSNNLSGIVDSNGIAKVVWNINQTDIDAGDGLGEGDILEFYYVANIAGFYNKISDELITNKNNITILPANCDIDITSGNNKLNANGIYFVNKSIEFNNTRSNENNINVVWSIEGQGESTIVKNEKSFVMNFSRAGQKIITLNANIPGCAQQSRQISILVIDDKPGLFAFINAPFYNQVFKLGVGGVGVDVNYRGNESYVVNSSGINCAKTLTCLAGNCPLFTSNTPENCAGDSIGITNSLIGDKFANLNFIWSKINRGIESPLKSGNGSDNSTGSINYARSSKSSNLGDKQIKLILNYTVVGTSLQGIFVRNFTVGTCVNNGNQRVNIDSFGRIINVSNTRSDRNACSNNGEGECCPLGFNCLSGLCQDTGSLITSCSGYTDEDACENDPFSASEFEYNTKVQVGLPGECNVNYRCEWRGNACLFNITQMDNLGNFGGSCLETAIPVVDSSCDNGELTKLINITSTSSGELACLTCQSGVFEVPCGRPSVELPFFGIWQFILSLISIVGLYLIMFRRNLRY